jgi:hypothetical protein
MRKQIVVSTLFFGVFLVSVSCGKILRAQENEWSGFPARENGDANGDWSLDVSDPVYLLSYLFLGGPAPVPIECLPELPSLQNGDVNGDAAIDLSDGIYLLKFLFNGGPAPVPGCGVQLDGAGAAATETPFTAIQGPPTSSTDGRVWFQAGFFHFRDSIVVDPLSGDLNGTITVTASGDVDTNTGRGHIFGSFVIEASWKGLEGTWEGHYTGTFLPGEPISARFTAQGAGGFAGTKLQGTSVETASETFSVEGVVFSPHG